MSDVRDAVAGNVAEVTMFLGFALLFLGGAAGVEIVFALGIVTFFAAVFLSDPLEALLRSGGDEATSGATDAADEDDHAVARLRERYAAGDIDEAEFERRLDRLLETEAIDETVEMDRKRIPEVK